MSQTSSSQSATFFHLGLLLLVSGRASPLVDNAMITGGLYNCSLQDSWYKSRYSQAGLDTRINQINKYMFWSLETDYLADIIWQPEPTKVCKMHHLIAPQKHICGAQCVQRNHLCHHFQLIKLQSQHSVEALKALEKLRPRLILLRSFSSESVSLGLNFIVDSSNRTVESGQEKQNKTF